MHSSSLLMTLCGWRRYVYVILLNNLPSNEQFIPATITRKIQRWRIYHQPKSTDAYDAYNTLTRVDLGYLVANVTPPLHNQTHTRYLI